VAQEAAEPLIAEAVHMRNRFVMLIGGAAMAAAFATVLPTRLAGQTKAAAPAQKSPAAAAMPRTPDGHPDFTGTYDLAMLTPLERPNGLPAVLSDEEAAKREKEAERKVVEGDAKIAGDRTAPPKGGDGSVGAAGNVGGYNTFWLDGGTKYPKINGERRTSLIVDPPDGRVPALTPEARQRNLSRLAQFRAPTSDASESQDPGLEPPGAYDDPERRPLGERCILGFGSTSGPPALPNYFYNNLHQIVQTRDRVMIQTEMVHDARIVRMNAEHLPPAIRSWMGDSVGHWEGDTLVVDTTNFTDKTRFRNSTQNLHVVERFSRLDKNNLLYRFTIEDPQTWTRPWTGEMAWPATSERIYEYACHEGNYALGDILRGARLREAEAAKTKEK
jgi:hypothetical protein